MYDLSYRHIQMCQGGHKDGLVYLLGDDGQLYFPEEMFLAKEKCDYGLIQFEVEGKWGFADILNRNAFCGHQEWLVQ